MMERLSVLLFALLVPSALGAAFLSPSKTVARSRLFAKEGGKGTSGGEGFVLDKTYGTSTSTSIKDFFNEEDAMKEFFDSNEEWSPLFRSMAKSASAPAMSFLEGNHGDPIDFDKGPWKRLQEMPSDEDDRAVLASFLDAMQQSLLDIPVNEEVQDDENDLHFLEEGRRMLAISRFHVLRDNSGGSVENFDSLFMTCWSELALLTHSDESNTGSLILLPEYDLTDLRHFADMYLQRPLEWLGMDAVFEVASMERESPAIRLLHKLEAMPTDEYLEAMEAMPADASED